MFFGDKSASVGGFFQAAFIATTFELAAKLAHAVMICLRFSNLLRRFGNVSRLTPKLLRSPGPVLTIASGGQKRHGKYG
jgi:hypothetical protein